LVHDSLLLKGLFVDLLGLRDNKVYGLFIIIIIDASLAGAVLSASLVVFETRAVQPNTVTFGTLATPLLSIDVN
jgi:hypothetical protein